MQHAICYISTASAEISDAHILKLLEKCKQHNSSLDIKGILLFSGGNFFQVLEGEKDNVIQLFSGIMKDKRHTNIIQVMGKDIVNGSLNGYITEHITRQNFSRSNLIESYWESVKGMDGLIRMELKNFLETFIDTRVL